MKSLSQHINESKEEFDYKKYGFTNHKNNFGLDSFEYKNKYYTSGSIWITNKNFKLNNVNFSKNEAIIIHRDSKLNNVFKIERIKTGESFNMSSETNNIPNDIKIFVYRIDKLLK